MGQHVPRFPPTHLTLLPHSSQGDDPIGDQNCWAGELDLLTGEGPHPQRSAGHVDAPLIDGRFGSRPPARGQRRGGCTRAA